MESTPSGALSSPLINLSGVSLEQLATFEDSVLIRSLDRALRPAEDPTEVVAAFNSCI